MLLGPSLFVRRSGSSPSPAPGHTSRAPRPKRNVLEMSLNVLGMVYYGGMWPRGQTWHNVYQILQASRLELLWNYLHLLGPLSSGKRGRRPRGTERI